MVGFYFTHDEVMEKWDASRHEKRVLRQIYNQWSGWPTLEDAAPIWHAASRETGNRNSAEVLFEDDKVLLGIEVRESDVELVESFRDHHRDLYRQVGMEKIELHRFVSEPVEKASGLMPKTVESWSQDKAHIPRFARNVAGTDEGSVVSSEMSVDSTYASYRTVEDLPIEQSEFVVALGPTTRYGHFTVRSLQDFMEEEGV